jgi:hypothetical protein
MRVVIRSSKQSVDWADRSNRRLAAGAASVFQALVFVVFAICVWRWSFDLGLTGGFLVQDGVFARWQVWFALAAALQFLASVFARYSRFLLRPEAGEHSKLRSWVNRRAA